MYWQVALSGNTMYGTVGEISAIMDNYGFTSSWRANDNASQDMWNASDPENSSTWLWAALPNVVMLDTTSMMIIKAEDIDGTLNIPTEAAANNN